jgi:hypothetical protein
MRWPWIRVDISLTMGDTNSEAPTGPDVEAQIGTHHEVSWSDTGMGFTTPANTPRWDDE